MLPVRDFGRSHNKESSGLAVAMFGIISRPDIFGKQHDKLVEDQDYMGHLS